MRALRASEAKALGPGFRRDVEVWGGARLRDEVWRGACLRYEVFVQNTQDRDGNAIQAAAIASSRAGIATDVAPERASILSAM